MIFADDKRGNGRCSNNAFEGLLAVAENFLGPYTLAAFSIFLFFWLTAFLFHLLSPKNQIQLCLDNL
jgi:hypothetical protein